jgi:hypothetical protein
VAETTVSQGRVPLCLTGAAVQAWALCRASARRATQRGLCHLYVLCSSARNEDIACVVRILTARLLIRIAEAVWACVRSE